jgi:hypothetical protein
MAECEASRKSADTKTNRADQVREREGIHQTALEQRLIGICRSRFVRHHLNQREETLGISHELLSWHTRAGSDYLKQRRLKRASAFTDTTVLFDFG